MADGSITVEVSTQAAQAELARLRAALDQKHAEYEDLKACAANNARNLAREAHTWSKAAEAYAAEIEQWRRAAQRCVTAWTVVRGGVWDPNGLMDEHVDALRKALGPNVAGNRLAEGKSELTGLLGGPTRSEKE